MTDNPRRPTDPRRALDDVSPPDQWDDITSRAADGGDTLARFASEAPNPARRPYVLAAAAVVVAAMIAGGLVLAARDDGGRDQVVAGPSEDPGFEAPAGVIGRIWLLTRFVQEGVEIDIPASAQYDPPQFEAHSDGWLLFRACNGGSAVGRVGEERITLEDEWMMQLRGCGGEEGEALMVLDGAMADLMRQGPVVELRGRALTLRTEEQRAEFVETDGAAIFDLGDVEADDSPTTTETEIPETAMLPSGDSACAVGLDPSVDPDGSLGLGPGPATPPVLEQSWHTQRSSATQGVWNVRHDGQRVEIDVPGLVVTDLLGERTEHVQIGDHGEATVWYSNEWVQVRYFTGDREPDPCGSFTVTAAGASEEANRDMAVAIATALAIRERSGAHQPDGTPPATIPPADAEGEDLVITEWAGMFWALEAIDVDGTVQRPASTPVGGGDGTGGPIVLEVTGGGLGLVARGCEEVALKLSDRGGRPWIALPPDQSSFGGCVGAGGNQWGKLLKILSLGAVPRMVPTDHGQVLLIANEEGSAAFWHP